MSDQVKFVGVHRERERERRTGAGGLGYEILEKYNVCKS